MNEVARRKRFLAVTFSVGQFIGVALIWLVFLAGVILILTASTNLASRAQPRVESFTANALAVVLPLSLLLLLFRRTRAYGGLGLFYSSFPLGFLLCLNSFLYVLAISIAWTLFGVLMAGAGIVPIATIMALIRGDWASLAGIVGMLVAVILLRGTGAWIAKNTE
jgi:hypothetical protein